MSRIHEALKKAEQDRATAQVTTQVTDISALPQQDAPVAATPAWEDAAGAPETSVVHAPTEAVTAPSTSVGGFEDMRPHRAQQKWHPDPSANVFSNPELGAHAAEQFRILRSKLYQLRSHQSLRTILVTSAVPKEGKTWVTTNLAQAIVRQSDRRALIIDADLRASRLHLPLGAPLTPGLSNYLKGEVDEETIIQNGGEGNLYLIAGGNAVANPSELLSNGRMKTLLERVSPMFDWVLIDSPPCLSVADAGILAHFCDGVLVVVRAGETPSTIAQKASHELEGRNVIGVVLNAVEDVPGYSSHYHYGYGNGNGSGRGIAKDSRN